MKKTMTFWRDIPPAVVGFVISGWLFILISVHFYIGIPSAISKGNLAAFRIRVEDMQGLEITENEMDQFIEELKLDSRSVWYTANVEYHSPTNWLVSLEPHKSGYITRRSFFMRLLLLDFKKAKQPTFQASSVPKPEKESEVKTREAEGTD